MKCEKRFLKTWIRNGPSHVVILSLYVLSCISYSFGVAPESENWKSKSSIHNGKATESYQKRNIVGDSNQKKTVGRVIKYPYSEKHVKLPEFNSILNRLPEYRFRNRQRTDGVSYFPPGLPPRKELVQQNILSNKNYPLKAKTGTSNRLKGFVGRHFLGQINPLKKGSLVDDNHRKSHQKSFNTNKRNGGKYKSKMNLKPDGKVKTPIMKSGSEYKMKSLTEIKKRFIAKNEPVKKRTGLVINHPLVELNIFGNNPLEQINSTKKPQHIKTTTVKAVVDSPKNKTHPSKVVPKEEVLDILMDSILTEMPNADIIAAEDRNFSDVTKSESYTSPTHANHEQESNKKDHSTTHALTGIETTELSTSSSLKYINQSDDAAKKKLLLKNKVTAAKNIIEDELLDILLKDKMASNGSNLSTREASGKFSTTVLTTYHPELMTESDVDTRSVEDVLQEESDPVTSDEFEDTSVSFGSRCDFRDENICWFDRELGDSLTLSINISSGKKLDLFVVRWFRIYRRKDQKSTISVHIKPEKCPWNVVLGSGGREMRINPITDSDADPNSIVAKVYAQTKVKGRKIDKLLKVLTYRINVLPIDMGPLYSGEELNINVENFLSLPEKGGLTFEWVIERSRDLSDPLPSNMKISSSGRSVVLKELKKQQIGPLACIVYSSNGISVAKRRFRLQKAMDELAKRSAYRKGPDEMSLPSYKVQRSWPTKCKPKPSARKAQMKFRSSKKISRRKRYRKSVEVRGIKDGIKQTSGKNCGPSYDPVRTERLTGRGERSVEELGVSDTDRSPQALDPRLTPLEKLIEESEKSDGTLDDVIPREVHYIDPEISVVTDGITGEVERSVDQLSFFANCTTDMDCGPKAFCVIPKGRDVLQSDVEGHVGYCYCRPEFFGDGFRCYRIQSGNHREKRIRRDSEEGFEITPDFDYSALDLTNSTTPQTQTIGTNPNSGFAVESSTASESDPKSMATFEEEDSYLMGSCESNRDCSSHANCEPTPLVNGHKFCKCRTSYRGNGLFCWEIVD